MDCNAINLPGSGTELSVNQPASELLEGDMICLYEALVRALQYVAMVTRYDIAYSGNLLSELPFKKQYAAIRIRFDITGATHQNPQI